MLFVELLSLTYVKRHILKDHGLFLLLCTDGYIVACVDVLQLTHGAVATVSAK